MTEATTPREVAEMIVAHADTEMERKPLIIGDSAMWAPQSTKNGVSIAQEINERLAELGVEIAIVQANKHHNKSRETDDETAEAIMRELGIRDDEDTEAVTESVADMWR
jgi:hypothetical protein